MGQAGIETKTAFSGPSSNLANDALKEHVLQQKLLEKSRAVDLGEQHPAFTRWNLDKTSNGTPATNLNVELLKFAFPRLEQWLLSAHCGLTRPV